MTEIYLNVSKEFLDKSSDEGKENSISEYGEDYKEDLTFKNLKFTDSPEFRFDNGSLEVSGGTDFGYISLDLNLDLDVVVDIIEFYMKKLGKLKTVLEATK